MMSEISLNKSSANLKTTSSKILAGFVISLLVLSILSTAIPVFGVGSATMAADPPDGTEITAADATDLTFTITNDGTTTIKGIQVRIDANWMEITPASVTTTGLGGTPSVSISGTGPYVVSISGILLDPTAAGKVKLLGMVAKVGTGAPYSTTISTYVTDSTETPVWSATVPASVTYDIVMEEGLATNLYAGITGDKEIWLGSPFPAQILKLHYDEAVNSDTTFTIVGRNIEGKQLIAKITVTPTTPTGVAYDLTYPLNIDTDEEKAFTYITEIYQAGGTPGDETWIEGSDYGCCIMGFTVTDMAVGGTKPIVAYLTDNDAAGVSASTVSFSISDGPSPAGSLSSLSVATDANGKATTTLTPSTNDGTTKVSVKYSGLTSMTVKVVTKPASLAAVKVEADPDTIEAVEGTEATITATLVDAYGNTIKDDDVDVYFGLSGPITFSGYDNTQPTTDGEAMIVVAATGSAKAGATATVRATAKGKVGSTTIRFISGAVSSISLTVSPSSLDLGGTANVTAKVTDANGNPISNVNVNFNFDPDFDWDCWGSEDFDCGDYAPTFVDDTGVTGVDGKVTVKFVASIEAGSASVTATAAGVTSDDKEIVVRVGSATRIMAEEIDSETIRADGNSETCMEWTLVDTYGNNVEDAGRIVKLTTNYGTLSSTEETTDGDGEIYMCITSTVTRHVATITATTGKISGTQDITFGGDATNAKLSAKPTTVFVNGESTITVQLIDELGMNAISWGETLCYYIDVQHGGWDGTAACDGGVELDTIVDDGESSATFTYYAPGEVPPGGVDTIVVELYVSTYGVYRWVQQQITVQVTDTPSTMSLTPSLTSAPGDGATLVKLSVKLLDADGNTIISKPGINIAFSTDVGTMTDEYGIGSTVAKTSTTSGVATIYVKAPLVPVGTASRTAEIIGIGGGVTGDTMVTFTPSAPAMAINAKVTDAETQDQAGAGKTTFAPGETVVVSTSIMNINPSAKTLLAVVQPITPSGTPLNPVYVSVELETNQEFTFAPSFVIPTGAASVGTWTIEVNVFNTFPMAGGVLQATPVSITFTVA